MSFAEDRKQIEAVAKKARALMFPADETVSLEDMIGAISRIGGRCKAVETLEYGEARVVPVQDDTETTFFEIQYLESLPEKAAIFAIAREFGYMLLYRVEPGVPGLNIQVPSQSAGVTVHEQRASEFAAMFLMPEKLFIRKVDELQITNIIQTKEMVELAKYFHVSVQAVVMRGSALKVW